MKSKLVLTFLLIIFIISCAGQSTLQRSYGTMKASKLTYETAMHSAADLYALKLITDEEKAKVIEYGNIYMKAHNTVVSAFQLYMTDTVNITKQEAYTLAINIASQELLKLVMYMTELERRKANE